MKIEFVSKLIEENGDLVMLMQPELFEKFGFKKDQIFVWSQNSDGSLNLKPTEIKSNL